MAQKNLRDFGAFLRRLREEKGYTQVQVAERLKGRVSLRTIGRWENGTHEPYLSELAPLLELLECDLHQAVSVAFPSQKKAA